jgi:hypothetical protein
MSNNPIVPNDSPPPEPEQSMISGLFSDNRRSIGHAPPSTVEFSYQDPDGSSVHFGWSFRDDETIDEVARVWDTHDDAIGRVRALILLSPVAP